MWYDKCKKIKVRLSNTKNYNQDILKVKDLVEVLGDFQHKDYTEQKASIHDFRRKGFYWDSFIERLNFGRVDNYLDKKLKLIGFESGDELRIHIDKEEEQDA